MPLLICVSSGDSHCESKSVLSIFIRSFSLKDTVGTWWRWFHYLGGNSVKPFVQPLTGRTAPQPVPPYWLKILLFAFTTVVVFVGILDKSKVYPVILPPLKKDHHLDDTGFPAEGSPPWKILGPCLDKSKGMSRNPVYPSTR